MWSNPGETVLSPFAGIGSEVYASVCSGRRGIGIELKASYYRQMVRNVAAALVEMAPDAQMTITTERAEERDDG